jgi:excisionase family DNA binding protein
MTQNQDPGSRLVDATQLGEIVGLSRATVLRLYREGKLPGLRYGHRTVRFERASAIQKLIDLGRAA